MANISIPPGRRILPDAILVDPCTGCWKPFRSNAVRHVRAISDDAFLLLWESYVKGHVVCPLVPLFTTWYTKSDFSLPLRLTLYVPR